MPCRCWVAAATAATCRAGAPSYSEESYTDQTVGSGATSASDDDVPF